jgi:hypothetical protein
MAIDIRLALAQQVKIGAVEKIDDAAHGISP